MTYDPHDPFGYRRWRHDSPVLVLPTYRVTTTHDGLPYCYEAEFTAVQFRTITAAPFPECANPANCLRLVTIWNRAGAGRYTYELA
jgi:hypothetical protein